MSSAVDPALSLEDLRMQKVLSMLPHQISSVLEIGARHGVMTGKLAKQFQAVTALDLTMPAFRIDGVHNVEGNVENIAFPDNSFDCVVCTEVLEHVPQLAMAARELARVTARYLLIGVPYRQDTRVGRLTCNHCGRISPPYGHLNTFDESRLRQLFPGLKTAKLEFLAENRERSNALSVWLQDLAGNPYGTYDQEEACVHCGNHMQALVKLAWTQRIAAALGVRLYDLQVKLNAPRATWILLLMEKAEQPA